MCLSVNLSHCSAAGFAIHGLFREKALGCKRVLGSMKPEGLHEKLSALKSSVRELGATSVSSATDLGRITVTNGTSARFNQGVSSNRPAAVVGNSSRAVLLQ